MHTADGSKQWWVYIIRTRNAQLYTGITTDIQRRWQEHLSGKGGARYFRTQTAQTLCFLEPHSDRSSASKREAAIKKLAKADKELLLLNHSLPVGINLNNEQPPE